MAKDSLSQPKVADEPAGNTPLVAENVLRSSVLAILLLTLNACKSTDEPDGSESLAEDSKSSVDNGDGDGESDLPPDLPDDSNSSTSTSDTSDSETETSDDTGTTEESESTSETETGDIPPDMPMEVPPPQVIGLGKNSIDAVCAPPPNENDCYILSSWDHHITFNTDHVESYVAELSIEGAPFELIDSGDLNGSNLVDILWQTPPLEANVILKITLTGLEEAISLTTDFRINDPWDGQWEVQ